MSEHLDAYRTSGSSPPVRAQVSRVQITPGSSVATGVAVDDLGRAILFGGDSRAILAIAKALEAGEVVKVYLDQWQIIAWRASRGARRNESPQQRSK